MRYLLQTPKWQPDMPACGSNLTLPPGVNETLLMYLIKHNRTDEALRLLPSSFKSYFSTNTSESMEPWDCVLRVIYPNFQRDSTLILIYGWVLLLTSVAGILGNSVVVSVYFKDYRNLSVFRWLLVHLALCDFLFSIMHMLASLPAIDSIHWPLKEIGCKVLRTLAFLGSLVCVGTMLMIAIERYFGILFCHVRSPSRRRAAIGLALVWFLSAVAVIPSGIALTYNPIRKDCDERWDHSGLSRNFGVGYCYAVLVVFAVFPMVTIAFCYVSIILYLRESRQCSGFLYANVNAAGILKRRKEHRRTVRMLIATVVMFYVCTLPGQICQIISQHLKIETWSVGEYYAFLYVGMIPFPFHVAMNPIIYSITDPSFRTSCADFLCLPRARVKVASGTTGQTLLLDDPKEGQLDDKKIQIYK